MRTTYAFDATNLAELDRFLRLEIIGEQSQGMDKGRTARIATAYVFDGEDMARRVAREWGGDAAQAVADRVITFMEAIRTERSRYWKVGFDLHGKHFEGTAMDNALTVRAQHEWVERRAGATGVQITEYTATLTSAVADADRLPRDESHQAPDVPGAQEVHRFYRFDGVGPAVLPDAAAVERTREWLRLHRPRRYALPLLLLDTVRTVVARPVDHDQVNPL
ncbi:hypothetical protein EDD99_8122 [Streptomyces sp. 846.5]|nr:hypothetical protein [Streptomyces sp. 846.5]TDT93313.1 hypothetical protein EDD99_8122 [Streptomyces sp. 846.5]